MALEIQPPVGQNLVPLGQGLRNMYTFSPVAIGRSCFGIVNNVDATSRPTITSAIVR
jgi:hypothetical protein